jgi:peptide chain release factor
MTTAQPSKNKLNELAIRFTSLNIVASDLIIKAILGSGSGGQKQNKTHNCIYIKHIPTGIEVKSQDSRSKHLNEFLAKRLLCDKLEERLGIKTKRLSKIEKIRKQKKRRTRKQTQGDDS